MSDIVTRLRQTRANMIGTEDEQHYWDCHDAADAIERLRLTDAERKAVEGLLERTNHDAAPAAKAQVDAAGISRQGTGDTPDAQTTLAQGSVRGECTEWRLTDEEREALRWCVSRPQTHWQHGIYAATLRGLLERTGAANSGDDRRSGCGE